MDTFIKAGFSENQQSNDNHIELSRGDMTLSIERTKRGIYCITMDNFIVYFNTVEFSPSGLCLILKRNNVKVGLIDLPGMAEERSKKQRDQDF